MHIGVISDTHSRHPMVEKALAILGARGIELVLHCGDIEDSETVQLFRGFQTHFVFGNCDWDQAGLHRAIEKIGGVVHENFGHLEMEGRKIAWIHGDDRWLFRDIENSSHYDFLFYGHSHVAEQHETGATRVVNPGALHRARQKTFVILDLKRGEIESVTVE
jgi:putative phosphoesterase